jgi:hypothetical protein
LFGVIHSQRSAAKRAAAAEAMSWQRRTLEAENRPAQKLLTFAERGLSAAARSAAAHSRARGAGLHRFVKYGVERARRDRAQVRNSLAGAAHAQRA